MRGVFKILFIFICYLLSLDVLKTIAKRINYFSTERPQITYINHDYFSYAKLTAQRYGRKDPVYYVGLQLHTLVPLSNDIIVHFYFYEFLTNQYKRGFIEMHMKFCKLIHEDKFFGFAMKRYFPPTCPVPAGIYRMYNMTIPLDQVPRGFPFTKGRIYCNLTDDKKQKIIGSGHIDLELKSYDY